MHHAWWHGLVHYGMATCRMHGGMNLLIVEWRHASCMVAWTLCWWACTCCLKGYRALVQRGRAVMLRYNGEHNCSLCFRPGVGARSGCCCGVGRPPSKCYHFHELRALTKLKQYSLQHIFNNGLAVLLVPSFVFVCFNSLFVLSVAFVLVNPSNSSILFLHAFDVFRFFGPWA
jgi:hypothetical protein